MKRLVNAVITFMFVFVSCKPDSVSEKKLITDSLLQHQEAVLSYTQNCAALYAEARKMDSILLGQTEVVPSSANAAMKAFTDFAYYCASDTLGPVFLIKTAQVARAVNNIPQAKVALEKCVENYPSFSNRAAAIFLLAQLYDEPTYLNNEHEAKKLYEQIISDYPKSDWAKSAKGAIQFLGKSDEEILEILKKKS